jgi:hypothetical protein
VTFCSFVMSKNYNNSVNSVPENEGYWRLVSSEITIFFDQDPLELGGNSPHFFVGSLIWKLSGHTFLFAFGRDMEWHGMTWNDYLCRLVKESKLILWSWKVSKKGGPAATEPEMSSSASDLPHLDTMAPYFYTTQLMWKT